MLADELLAPGLGLALVHDARVRVAPDHERLHARGHQQVVIANAVRVHPALAAEHDDGHASRLDLLHEPFPDMQRQRREAHHLVARDGWHAVVERELVTLVGERADQPDLASHVVALDEQRGTDDEDVDAEAAGEFGRLTVDPAVDVHLTPECLVAEQAARGEQLVAGDVFHELLPAEPGLDRHHHHDVEQLPVRLEGAQGRGRFHGQARRATGRADPPQGRGDLLLDLDVDRDRVAAGVEELLDVAARLADHQVRVERELRPRSKVLDGLGTERQVRDEVAVHDVEMDAVGTGLLDAADRVGEVREVGVEDARRDTGTAGLGAHSPTPAGTGS